MFGRKKETIEGPPVEGAPKARWHPETLWCSLFGHFAPAADARNVSPEDALIAIRINEGAHMSRCLRCDMWFLTDESKSSHNSVAQLQDVQIPKRGKALRDAIILKIIAIDRGVHSIVFALVFIGVLFLESHLGSLQTAARHLVDNAQTTLNGTGAESSHDYVNKELNRFADLKAGSLKVLLITAGVYAVVEGLEAFGLWRQRRWAEYLTALATAGFLPFEIHELLDKVTVLRISALVINVVVLVYLLWAKSLFGLNGGFKEDLDAEEAAEAITPLPGQIVGAQTSPS